MAFQGIDVRGTTDRLVFRALLQDTSAQILTSGTVTLKLYELQSDGTLKSYDFNDNTFKTGVLTTETLAMTHRTGNNGGSSTGIWTVALATLSGFTKGNIYFIHITSAGASPPVQVREFQFGSAQGDLTVDASNNLNVNVSAVAANALTAAALATDAVAEIQSGLATSVDVATLLTRLSAARAGYLDNLNVGGIVASSAEAAAILARTDVATSTRLATASYTTPDNATIAAIATYVDTEIAAIKAKTDNLPSDPADASDITSAFGTVNATLATIAAYVDTEVAAIKSKTDQLTFTVANRVDAQTLGLATDVLTADALATSAVNEIAAAVPAANFPTVEEIDAELTANHGTGSWRDSGGSPVIEVIEESVVTEVSVAEAAE